MSLCVENTDVNFGAGFSLSSEFSLVLVIMGLILLTDVDGHRLTQVFIIIWLIWFIIFKKNQLTQVLFTLLIVVGHRGNHRGTS